MQRKLYIFRHGKSSWDYIVNDIDRPLNERGVNSSFEMAKRLELAGDIPETIYTSPANRALHTAIIMARVWNVKDSNIHIASKLYLPQVDNIISLIFEIPDDETSVAIFGHNPGFVDFANRFLEEPIENLPTAGVVVVTMEIESWSDIVDCKINDVYIDCPKKNKK